MIRSDKKIGLLLLLAFVGAYLLGMVLLFDSVFIFQAFLFWGTNLAIVILLIGPFVWIMNWKKQGLHAQYSIRLLGLAALIFLINLLLLLSPSYGWFSSLDWNWQGKLLSLALIGLFIVLWPGLTWRDIGFTRSRKGTWLRVFSILAGAAVFWILAGSAGVQPTKINMETLLFQATMPGLEEELIFRGILWVLIARAIPGSRHLWGANVGWNLIVTTLLFALVHGVKFNEQLNLVFDPGIIIFSGVIGFLLGWVRAYSGSIIPVIVLHNGYNLLVVIVPWFV
jgi:hypothetical protein